MDSRIEATFLLLQKSVLSPREFGKVWKMGLRKYWVGQKVYSGFSVRCYGKP